MDYDEQDRPGWVRLPPADEDAWAGRSAVASRAEGVRRVRRASNWTAAALIAGVAAASGYFAHQTPPATSAAGSVTQTPPARPGPRGGRATRRWPAYTRRPDRLPWPSRVDRAWPRVP